MKKPGTECRACDGKDKKVWVGRSARTRQIILLQ